MDTTRTRRLIPFLAVVLVIAAGWPAGLGPLWSTPAAEAAFPGDNGRLAFASDRVTPANATGDFEIFTVKLDGSDLQQLTNNLTDDRWPAWSPDGKKIAYANGANHIVVMDANGSSPTPLTSGSGADALPAWAPGGGLIAFTRFQGGQTNIFTMQSNGTNQTQITTGAWNSEPDWSPDGSRIAFEQRQGASFALYTMLIDGSDQQRVIPASATSDRDPSWSPDGTRIAFYRQVGFQNDIFVVNADGSGEVNLTNAARNEYAPIWSPDGTAIAFVADDAQGFGEIMTMNANGSNPQPLATNPATDEAPSWQAVVRRVPPIVKGPPKFARGDLIVFSSTRITAANPEGDPEIFTLRLDLFTGGVLTQLTSNSVEDSAPAWSPDGSRIAFTRAAAGSSEIYLMNADGSNVTRLTNDSRADREPAWSPDGSRITWQGADGAGNPQIFVMNANGTNQVQITNLPGGALHPTWSPGGTRIAFASVVNSQQQGIWPQVFTVSPAGANLTQLTSVADGGGGGNFDPAWSPDGTRIAFASGRESNIDIYTMSADGGNQIRRTTNNADDDAPAWSPDGKQLVFVSTRDGNPELYTMKVNGTNQTRRTNATGLDDFPEWSAGPGQSAVPHAPGQNGQGQAAVGGDQGKNRHKHRDKQKHKEKKENRHHGAHGKHRNGSRVRDNEDREAWGGERREGAAVMFADQEAVTARFDWGEAGVQCLAPHAEVVVVVDVLSFATAVDVAVSRGAVVYPCRWRDGRAEALAERVEAVLAGTPAGPDQVVPYSLSPLLTPGHSSRHAPGVALAERSYALTVRRRVHTSCPCRLPA